uniref:Uncharacterized protein n=1 Tax=Arundo donax TaxID=35708 RepID=A0A0A8ZPL9_ARUDO
MKRGSTRWLLGTSVPLVDAGS